MPYPTRSRSAGPPAGASADAVLHTGLLADQASRQGDARSARKLLDRAACLGAAPHRNVRARGIAALRSQDYAAAWHLLQAAVSASNKHNDRVGLAASLCWLAAVEARVDVTRAHRHTVDALRLVRRERHWPLLPRCLAMVGVFDFSVKAGSSDDPELHSLALAGSLRPDLEPAEALSRWSDLQGALAGLPPSAGWVVPLVRHAMSRAVHGD